MNDKNVNFLQPIPQKKYFTIGEVSELCRVKPHVLRYWEQEFTQLSPSKRKGNRRYYEHKDVVLVRKIYDVLYNQGFTIGGARQHLSEREVENKNTTFSNQRLLKEIILEMEQLLNIALGKK